MNKLISLMVVSALTTTSVLAKETKTIEKFFEVGSGASFSIENINGSIDIESTNGDRIEMIATLTAKDEAALERIEILTNQTGNDVTVSTEYEQNRWGKNNSGGVEYTIKLPANVTSTDVELVNGGLMMEGISGEVDAELVNGAIEATGLNGTGQFNSVNGSIKLTYDDLANVNRIDADTVNGSIKIYLPDEANIKVDAETMHGSIKTDYGLKAKKNLFAGRHLKGSVGSADTKLKLESVNGSIKVLKK